MSGPVLFRSSVVEGDDAAGHHYRVSKTEGFAGKAIVSRTYDVNGVYMTAAEAERVIAAFVPVYERETR